MRRNAKPELLAPAATPGIALAAFAQGADAVYVGGERFSLRAQSPGLDRAEIRELLDVAHETGKRVYVALNSMPSDDDLDAISGYVRGLVESRPLPDAFIVADPAVVTLCREMAPSVPLHLSTQTGTFSVASARFWNAQGVSRVILPRELSLDDVRRITAAAPCETEVFVHGAMCVSVSGRCLLGAYLNGRHANHGDCPQPCRLRYRIAPVAPGVDEAGEWLTVEEDNEGAFLLNSRDLKTLSILPSIAATGVAAVKIEGRTKGEHYVSTVVRVYRQALDEAWESADGFAVRPAWDAELDALEHRTYTTGFYVGENALQSVHASKSMRTVRVVGVVRETLASGEVIVEVKSTFAAGEVLEVLPSSSSRQTCPVTVVAVSDIEGRVLERATANRVVRVRASVDLRNGDMLRAGGVRREV